MKKGLLAVLTVFCLTASGAAQENPSGRLGMGLILGSPTGITAKYWLDKTRALDAALGFGDVSIHADYLWHRRDLLPQPQTGRLVAYWGLGAKVQDSGKDIEFGLRAAGGAAYHFPRQPAEVFLEVVPILELTPDAGLEIDAGLGVRYYFQ